MTAVAQDDPPPLEVLAGYQRNGRAWWPPAPGRRRPRGPGGVLLVDVVDGAAHVEQVSVHPAHARRRLGSALLETAAAWAAENRLEAVTLTTFTEVPWNAPYYARLGFRVVPADEIGEGYDRSGSTRPLPAWTGGPASSCAAAYSVPSSAVGAGVASPSPRRPVRRRCRSSRPCRPSRPR
jgi:GNAT superfamily N-acetyltransferase